VGEVERLLAASHDLPDAKLAGKISGLELVERASSARLVRWQNQFQGKRTRQALQVLADASSFLELPPDDIPPQPPPTTVAMTEIFQRAVAYANTVIKKLPNFSARRTTTHFDDVSPLLRTKSQYSSGSTSVYHATSGSSIPPPSGTLLPAGDQTSIVVTYRDGQEVLDAAPEKNSTPASRVIGLTTRGEFGPILSVVTEDAANGKVFWSHWEQGASGPLAVFRYLIHQEDSHFSVIGGGNMSRCPSYHGEIAVDPETGAILRITMVSDWKPPFQPSISAIVVEYGPVEIGNATYTCPIKGIALSKVPVGAPVTNQASDIPLQTFLNDVTFTEYHVFRSEIRILP
jgi:hypothetical protein